MAVRIVSARLSFERSKRANLKQAPNRAARRASFGPHFGFPLFCPLFYHHFCTWYASLLLASVHITGQLYLLLTLHRSMLA
jgi:hypothetical protein